MKNCEKHPESLITANPQEGWGLAVELARKSVAIIQYEPDVTRNPQPDNAHNSSQLIASAKAISLEFQTIGMANNYWKP